jgi:hypothetical protein
MGEGVRELRGLILRVALASRQCRITDQHWRDASATQTRELNVLILGQTQRMGVRDAPSDGSRQAVVCQPFSQRTFGRQGRQFQKKWSAIFQLVRYRSEPLR